MTRPADGPLAATRPTSRPRWFGAGRSEAADPRTAGGQATVAAVAGRRAALLIVHTTFEHALEPLLRGVRAAAGPAPAIGGRTGGGGGGAGGRAGGVDAGDVTEVAALGGPGFEVRAAGSPVRGGRPQATGAALAVAVGDTRRPHRVLVVLGDPAPGRWHELARGVRSVTGPRVPLVTPYAGGLGPAGADAGGCRFLDTGDGVQVFRGGAVAALVGSDGPIAIGVAHGWRPHGDAVALPEAVDVAGTDPAGARPVDRAVTMVSWARQGVVAWLPGRGAPSPAGEVSESGDQAVAGLGGAPVLGVLAFDTAVRSVRIDPHQVLDAIGGARGVHHTTSVAVAFG